MRTFPNVWVPPGGGIEIGETLRETGLRELQEEAGLSISSSDIESEEPLCFWESCYPQTLSRGQYNQRFVATLVLPMVLNQGFTLTRLSPKNIS